MSPILFSSFFPKSKIATKKTDYVATYMVLLPDFTLDFNGTTIITEVRANTWEEPFVYQVSIPNTWKTLTPLIQ